MVVEASFKTQKYKVRISLNDDFKIIKWILKPNNNKTFHQSNIYQIKIDSLAYIAFFRKHKKLSKYFQKYCARLC